MGSYLTIDGGTTTTRVCLVRDKKIINMIKIAAGAKVGIDNKDFLKCEIKKAIDELTDTVDVDRILASGMITSDFGLYHLPHVKAPAGMAELHNGICEITLNEISDIPFVFIPGIKMLDGSLKQTDMMRGEETELLGSVEKLLNNCIYVLPGSHSKLIRTDREGRISKFTTALTGEMLSALSQATILKDAVDLSQTESDSEYLMKGYNYCEKNGINEALFKTRILKNLFHCTAQKVYSFFVGTVLQAEIKEIIEAEEAMVVIGGKAQIKKSMAKLLRMICDKDVRCIPDEKAHAAPAVGAIRIYEYTETR